MSILPRVGAAAGIGGVIAGVTYAYNRAGELNKLPDTWNYMTPSWFASSCAGGIAFVAGSMARAPSAAALTATRAGFVGLGILSFVALAHNLQDALKLKREREARSTELNQPLTGRGATQP